MLVDTCNHRYTAKKLKKEKKGWKPRNIVTNVLDCDIVVSSKCC